MGIEHVNRKGERYFLQSTTGRGGTPRYSFTRKVKGTPVSTIPEGYRVYESPEDAQVFLRKVETEAILPLERRLVIGSLRKAGLEHFIVDVQVNNIVVYLPDFDADDFSRLLMDLGHVRAAKARALGDAQLQRSRYSKMMRFTLLDSSERRLFNCDRWCFSGGIDDWYFLSGSAPLSELLEEYAKHLGKESFFDLM